MPRSTSPSTAASPEAVLIAWTAAARWLPVADLEVAAGDQIVVPAAAAASLVEQGVATLASPTPED
jgi:hypothetical protein